MPLRLTWKDSTRLPVDAGRLLPETLARLSTAEVGAIRVAVGNGSAEVAELFRVDGSAEDGAVDLVGDLTPARGVGAGMASGRLTVRGGVGPGAGVGMAGGELTIEGSAGPWAGAEMAGGTLRVGGDAGDDLGAALPGSRSGMKDGLILVGGSAGRDVGLGMRRGLIAVRGPVGDGFGRALIAGTVLAFGPTGADPAVGIRRGTVGLFAQPDPADPGLSPTFAPSGRWRPPVLAIYLKHLADLGFPVPRPVWDRPVARYNGDLADRGQGEVFVLMPG